MTYLPSLGRARTWLFASFFFLANPAYFTSCSGSGYEFDDREMRELLTEVNAQQWEMDRYTLELDLHQTSEGPQTETAHRGTSFIRSAHACDNRAFVASAAACIDSTEMAVSGMGWVLDEEDEVIGELAIEGILLVDGWKLTNATLFLDFEEGNATIHWDEDGEPEFTLSEFRADGLGETETDIDFDESD